jgi:hypothetical protein
MVIDKAPGGGENGNTLNVLSSQYIQGATSSDDGQSRIAFFESILL